MNTASGTLVGGPKYQAQGRAENLARRPNDLEPLPIIVSNRSIRGAYAFRPSVYCTHLMEQTGVTLSKPPEVDWSAQVITCQTLRDYDVLCGLERPKSFRGSVQINTPSPQRAPICGDSVLFLCESDSELAWSRDISAKIKSRTVVDQVTVEELRRAAVVVKLAFSRSCVDMVALCIENGCRMVTSDAGGAVEFLGLAAKPGTWHVMHTLDKRDWSAAILDMLGHDVTLAGSDYMDLLPYLGMTWMTKGAE